MPENQNAGAFRLDAIIIHQQTIACDRFLATNEEKEIIAHALNSFGFLLTSTNTGGVERCSFAQFADQIEANYSLDEPTTKETVCVLRAAHARIEAFKPIGFLALKYSNVSLPIQVLKSRAGFYIGTIDDGGPCSRESAEYWPTQALADEAMKSQQWTQRPNP